MDFSLDALKLREIYEKVYRRIDFSWIVNDKEYSSSIICVTFHYSVKPFNCFKVGGRTQGKHKAKKSKPKSKSTPMLYVANGFAPVDAKLSDCVCIREGQLIAIQTNTPISEPQPPEVLGKFFCFRDGVYHAKPQTTELSVAQLRYELYKNGFLCDGVHYVRLKRSSGSSRVGKCLFIDERLYSRMHKWDLCGLKIKEGDTLDLAAFESYIALPSSSIIDTISIDPKRILLIPDYESVFVEDAVATSLDNGRLKTERRDVEIHNSIWDGQSLIQTQVMGKYARYGFLLLRNRFFKSACFSCDIQQWFEDHDITDISQLNGQTRAERIEDIVLITTPSSIKYLKFGTFDGWLDNIDPMFGIVKHEKPTHHFGGKMVQTHYQLLNTLQLSLSDIQKLLQPSLDFLSMLKTDPSVFRFYLHCPEKMDNRPGEMYSKSDIVYRLLGLNARIAQTEMYADFRNSFIKSFVKDIRKGKLLVDGTYATLCGNPVEMLLHSVGQFDGASQIGVGRVYNTFFPAGSRMLGSRSPHVANGNVWLTTISHNSEIERYFRVTPQIIYINSIGENLLERLSGADFDSDQVLITNNSILISAAEKHYGHFPVPTGLVKAAKASRQYTTEDLADLDIQTSVNKIGEIINLSQELNSRLWDMINKGASPGSTDVQSLYCDIAKLDVMSNLEIDKAKKILPVNNVLELKSLKAKYRIKDHTGRVIKPNFFAPIARDKGFYNAEKTYYAKHLTSMDFVQHVMNRFRLPKDSSPYISFADVFNADDVDSKLVKYEQIKKILSAARKQLASLRAVWKQDGGDQREKYVLSECIHEQFVKWMSTVSLSKSTAAWLLRALEKTENSDVANMIFFALFQKPNRSTWESFISFAEPVEILSESVDGDIEVFEKKYTKNSPNWSKS